MITARNYAAQAERDLKLEAFKNITLNLKASDLQYKLLKIISLAQHFALPDEGFLLADNLKGLSNIIMNLPYDYMTIEFFCKENVLPQHITKYLFIAHSQLSSTGEKLGFNVMWMFYNKDRSRWELWPFGVNVKSQFINNVNDIKYDTFEITGANRQFFGEQLIDDREKFILDVVFELLEALTCRNVYTESLEPVDTNKNAKRIKKGKLPLYETKILVVDSKEKVVDKTDKGGTHASPRQHLRRGHIRRYPTYSIWINNTVVGKSSNGVIEKSYSVI